MGMGYDAAYAVTIEKEQIEKLELKTFTELQTILNENGIDFDEFSRVSNEIYLEGYSRKPLEEYVYKLESQYEIEIEADKLAPIIHAYFAFKKEFESETGIAIYLEHHAQEEQGSLYDDVSEGFFTLDYSDVYVLSDNARKLQQKVHFETSTFVVFG